MKMKNRTVFDSFNNAISGIIHAVRTERNLKFHVSAAVMVIVLSLFYNISKIEFIIVCLSIGAVIVCELFNTAIETLVDLVVEGYHPKVKIVKDVAAGAVVVSAFISLIVGYFIFFDKISDAIENGIGVVKKTPMNIIIISLVITVMIVVVVKAFFKKGTPLSGGMPSGHAAIALSITTGVGLWSDNITITVLFLAISALLIQSRLEGKIHTIFELLAGSALGFLVTLLLFKTFF